MSRWRCLPLSLPFVALLVGALLAVCLRLPPPAVAQPSAWPTVWSSLGTDPNDCGGSSSDHRDVLDALYAVDDAYLYLRLENVGSAGWPGTGPSGEARYKWFIDTAGGDVQRSGGNVVNAEFLLMVEDLTDNANDPSGPRDQVGEITLMDAIGTGDFTARWDSANPPRYTTNTPDGTPSPSNYWRRLPGTGAAGVGGLQGVESDPDVGYRVTGTYVDMYVRLAHLGSPASVQVMWASDTNTNNLDQSPNCDRDDLSSGGAPVPLATATPTDTATPIPGATATPTPTPILVGGHALGSIAVAPAAGLAAASGTTPAAWIPVSAGLLLAALLGWTRRRSD